MQMVEAHDRLGRPPIGGEFVRHRDIFNMARVAWQRIGRWLDDQTKDKTHMPASFVPAVLLSLPEDRRLRAVNEMLAQVGLVAEPLPGDGGEATEFSRSLGRLCKEAGEAHAAVAALTDGADGKELDIAESELEDSLSITLSALHQVRVAKAKAVS